MQRFVRVCCAALMLLAIVGCGGKEPATSTTTQPRAVNTLQGIGVWSFLEDGKLSANPIGYLDLAAVVEVLPEEPKVASQSGADRTFMKIRSEIPKLEGWVRMDFVIKDAVPGVITAEDASVYSAAANTAATADRLERMAIVAVHEPKGGDTFVKITTWVVATRRLYAEQFVRADTLSTTASDVGAAVLLHLAQASDQATRREALLSSAAKDYPGSAFSKEVALALSMLKGEATNVTTIMLSPEMVIETTDELSVRSGPDAEWATVKATLAQGQRVRAQERTTDEFTIGGKTGPWYRISDPEGWIFGGYVKELPDGMGGGDE